MSFGALQNSGDCHLNSGGGEADAAGVDAVGVAAAADVASTLF